MKITKIMGKGKEKALSPMHSNGEWRTDLFGGMGGHD